MAKPWEALPHVKLNNGQWQPVGCTTSCVVDNKSYSFSYSCSLPFVTLAQYAHDFFWTRPQVVTADSTKKTARKNEQYRQVHFQKRDSNGQIEVDKEAAKDMLMREMDSHSIVPKKSYLEWSLDALQSMSKVESYITQKTVKGNLISKTGVPKPTLASLAQAAAQPPPGKRGPQQLSNQTSKPQSKSTAPIARPMQNMPHQPVQNRTLSQHPPQQPAAKACIARQGQDNHPAGQHACGSTPDNSESDSETEPAAGSIRPGNPQLAVQRKRKQMQSGSREVRKKVQQMKADLKIDAKKKRQRSAVAQPAGPTPQDLKKARTNQEDGNLQSRNSSGQLEAPPVVSNAVDPAPAPAPVPVTTVAKAVVPMPKTDPGRDKALPTQRSVDIMRGAGSSMKAEPAAEGSRSRSVSQVQVPVPTVALKATIELVSKRVPQHVHQRQHVNQQQQIQQPGRSRSATPQDSQPNVPDFTPLPGLPASAPKPNPNTKPNTQAPVYCKAVDVHTVNNTGITSTVPTNAHAKPSPFQCFALGDGRNAKALDVEAGVKLEGNMSVPGKEVSSISGPAGQAAPLSAVLGARGSGAHPGNSAGLMATHQPQPGMATNQPQSVPVQAAAVQWVQQPQMLPSVPFVSSMLAQHSLVRASDKLPWLPDAPAQPAPGQQANTAQINPPGVSSHQYNPVKEVVTIEDMEIEDDGPTEEPPAAAVNTLATEAAVPTQAFGTVAVGRMGEDVDNPSVADPDTVPDAGAGAVVSSQAGVASAHNMSGVEPASARRQESKSAKTPEVVVLDDDDAASPSKRCGMRSIEHVETQMQQLANIRWPPRGVENMDRNIQKASVVAGMQREDVFIATQDVKVVFALSLSRPVLQSLWIQQCFWARACNAQKIAFYRKDLKAGPADAPALLDESAINTAGGCLVLVSDVELGVKCRIIDSMKSSGGCSVSDWKGLHECVPTPVLNLRNDEAVPLDHILEGQFQDLDSTSAHRILEEFQRFYSNCQHKPFALAVSDVFKALFRVSTYVLCTPHVLTLLQCKQSAVNGSLDMLASTTATWTAAMHSLDELFFYKNWSDRILSWSVTVKSFQTLKISCMKQARVHADGCNNHAGMGTCHHTSGNDVMCGDAPPARLQEEECINNKAFSCGHS